MTSSIIWTLATGAATVTTPAAETPSIAILRPGNGIHCPCAEYWVEETGAWTASGSIWPASLRADQHGDLMSDPPLPWSVESSPHTSLAVPLIAEAVGCRLGRLSRRELPADGVGRMERALSGCDPPLVRGDPGIVGEVATCIARSARSLRGRAGGCRPETSINFVTCHDGFTLNDLVSYNTSTTRPTARRIATAANDNLSWKLRYRR